MVPSGDEVRRTMFNGMNPSDDSIFVKWIISVLLVRRTLG
jgi:hypothetical protein